MFKMIKGELKEINVNMYFDLRTADSRPSMTAATERFIISIDIIII
jgi:hypothetical protein